MDTQPNITQDASKKGPSSQPKNPNSRSEIAKIVVASSSGTMFEWFDFFLAITLADIFASHFFNGVSDPETNYIFALLSFAVGFIVRPFGSIFFGRMGDIAGRKKTFMLTIIIMGVSTAIIGILPTYDTAGIIAPILLILCRVLQGLAVGGEYAGAAIYVAEHFPSNNRGFATSSIQITGTLGLLTALLVTQAARSFGPELFNEYLWRVPFLLSLLFLAYAIYIRSKLEESPVFQDMKAEAAESKAPLSEALGKWENLKVVLAALFGSTAGQGVVWYTGQFYSLIFLTKILGLDSVQANVLIAASLIPGVVGLVFFGWLSDRVGRKPIVLGGMILAACTYFPLFGALEKAVNPDLVIATKSSPVIVGANSANCSFQFDPVGKATFTQPCDVAKKALASRGIPYSNIELPGAEAFIKVGDTVITSYDAQASDFEEKAKAFNAALNSALTKAGYKPSADPEKVDKVTAIGILTILTLFVGMVYGPMAAWLVELFPARIRYTGMSIPYHFGNGWFGGLLPAIAVAMVVATGDIFQGLWFSVLVAGASAIIGFIALPETKGRDISHRA